MARKPKTQGGEKPFDPVEAAKQINAKHRKAEASWLQNKEDNLAVALDLREAKYHVGHGNFGPWIDTYCEFGRRMARYYLAHLKPNKGELTAPETHLDIDRELLRAADRQDEIADEDEDEEASGGNDSLGGNASVTLNSSESVTLNGNTTTTLSGNASVTLKGSDSLTLGGSASITVNQAGQPDSQTPASHIGVVHTGDASTTTQPVAVAQAVQHKTPLEWAQYGLLLVRENLPKLDDQDRAKIVPDVQAVLDAAPQLLTIVRASRARSEASRRRAETRGGEPLSLFCDVEDDEENDPVVSEGERNLLEDLGTDHATLTAIMKNKANGLNWPEERKNNNWVWRKSLFDKLKAIVDEDKTRRQRKLG